MPIHLVKSLKTKEPGVPAACFSCKNWFNNRPGALVKFHHNSYQHGKHRYCKYCLPSVMGIPTEEEQLKYVESLPDSDTE